MDQPAPLFERLVVQERPLWARLVISLTLLSLPFGAARLDGLLSDVIQEGSWRTLLIPPVVIVYIWLVAPHMDRLGRNVVDALRSLSEIDEGEFDRRIAEVSNVPLLNELSVVGVGCILGILTATTSDINGNAPWLESYWFISSAAFYGLLAWTIYAAIMGTRVNAELHRLPLRVNVFDTSPFEVIGRQSLLIALVFVGGITLSFLLAFQQESFASPAFWINYLLLVLLTVVIFFLNMLPTHQVLAAEKKSQLDTVDRQIISACQKLMVHLGNDQETGELAGQINALAVYQERLERTMTWPYNTNMLRTLFFSVLIPLGTALGRLAGDLFFD
jgi:hypothetical protein